MPAPIPPLNREWIAARLPHQGAMCLLDAVVAWDDDTVRCTAGRIDAADHPLREAGRVPALAAIEYAAQAMAVHGALLQQGAAAQGAASRPRVGYLASVRKVELHADRLDTLPAPLIVDAERVSGDGTQVLYQFAVRAGEQLVLTGRAAVVLDADKRGEPAGTPR